MALSSSGVSVSPTAVGVSTAIGGRGAAFSQLRSALLVDDALPTDSGGVTNQFFLSLCWVALHCRPGSLTRGVFVAMTVLVVDK